MVESDRRTAHVLRQTGGCVDLRQSAEVTHAELHSCSLVLPADGSLRWSDSQLIDCRASGGDLGELRGCCLRGAILRGVRIHSLVDCDLRHAVLEDVDLSGADLRGARLEGAKLLRCQLNDVQAHDAAVQGLSGLGPEALEALHEAGARRPGPRRALLTLITAALMLALLVSLLPPAPRGTNLTSPAGWSPGPLAAEQTRSQLADFRAGIRAANLNLKGRGGRTYPTLEEVQANHYDLDGDGPGEALGVLFPKGLPRNLLSPGEGSVLPYCNAVPDQRTLSQEDADWHYCPETGRVLASAGHTEEPTLQW